MSQTQLNCYVLEHVKGYDFPIFVTAQNKLPVKSADGPNTVVKLKKLLFEYEVRLLLMLFHNSGWFLDQLFLFSSHSFNLIPLHFLHQPPFLLPEVRLKQ